MRSNFHAYYDSNKSKDSNNDCYKTSLLNTHTIGSDLLETILMKRVNQQEFLGRFVWRVQNNKKSTRYCLPVFQNMVSADDMSRMFSMHIVKFQLSEH